MTPAQAYPRSRACNIAAFAASAVFLALILVIAWFVPWRTMSFSNGPTYLLLLFLVFSFTALIAHWTAHVSEHPTAYRIAIGATTFVHLELVVSTLPVIFGMFVEDHFPVFEVLIFLLIVLAIATLVWNNHHNKIRLKNRLNFHQRFPHLCRHCFYDLRATAHPVGPLFPICPECGYVRHGPGHFTIQ